MNLDLNKLYRSLCDYEIENKIKSSSQFMCPPNYIESEVMKLKERVAKNPSDKLFVMVSTDEGNVFAQDDVNMVVLNNRGSVVILLEYRNREDIVYVVKLSSALVQSGIYRTEYHIRPNHPAVAPVFGFTSTPQVTPTALSRPSLNNTQSAITIDDYIKTNYQHIQWALLTLFPDGCYILYNDYSEEEYHPGYNAVEIYTKKKSKQMMILTNLTTKISEGFKSYIQTLILPTQYHNEENDIKIYTDEDYTLKRILEESGILDSTRVVDISPPQEIVRRMSEILEEIKQ